jgi:competence protein ComEA
MRAHKRMIALVLALMMTLCWAGLSLAADTKATGQTEVKTDTKAATSQTTTKTTTDTKKKAAKKKAAKKKAPSKPININTASEKELRQLIGVGPKTAKAIVDYRKKHGAFKTPEDIMKVKGIGKKTFGKNKAYIVIK